MGILDNYTPAAEPRRRQVPAIAGLAPAMDVPPAGPLSRAASMAPRIAVGAGGLLAGTGMSVPDEQPLGFANGGIIPGDDIAEQFDYQSRQENAGFDDLRAQNAEQDAGVLAAGRNALLASREQGAATVRASIGTMRSNEGAALDEVGEDKQALGYANGGLIGDEDQAAEQLRNKVASSLADDGGAFRNAGTGELDNLNNYNLSDMGLAPNAINSSPVRSIMGDNDGIGGGSLTRGLLSESAFGGRGGHAFRGFANGGLIDNPLDPRQRAVPRIAGPAPSVPALQVPLYSPESVPRITGPSANLPAQQVPWYTPETPARLAGPQPANAPPAPVARLAGGAAGLLAGGVAATEAATGTVAANPDYFKTSIGDDGLAANILLAADSRRNDPPPSSVPRIAQLPASASDARVGRGASGDWVSAPDAGAGRGSVNPPNALSAGAGHGFAIPTASAAAPKFDDTYRAENLRNMTNQAFREGDQIGDSIRQKMGADITQPAAGGDGAFLPVSAQSGSQPPRSPIAFATFGGGQESSKAYYTDGRTVDLKASQPLPQDVQDFNRLSAQVGREAQQPVSVIRGLQQTVAMPNPAAGESSGFMREAPVAAYDAGKVPEFFAAQAQNALNVADPLAAKTASEVAVKNVENKGKTDAAQITANAHLAAAQAQGQFGKVPPGYRMAADGLSMEKIPGGPADLGKALPSPAVKELSGAGEAVEATMRMVNSFKPEFGGKTITGGLSNTVGRIMGDDSGQTQWWQDMEMRQNLARNALFGASQTKGELEAWEKTSVNPRMDPNEILKNLTLRAEIEARAASKLARGYAAAGYSKDQIGELLGTGSEFLEKPAPAVEKQAGSGQKAAAATVPAPGRPAPSDQARVEDIAGKTAAVGKAAAKTGDPANYSPKAGTIEGGYRFKGGNPADPRSWEKA